MVIYDVFHMRLDGECVVVFLSRRVIRIRIMISCGFHMILGVWMTPVLSSLWHSSRPPA
jgi:amino acid permease